MAFISGEQGNNSLKLKKTGEQRQFWGTGNIENQAFDFGNKGKCLFFLGNKGTGTPSPTWKASILILFLLGITTWHFSSMYRVTIPAQ